MAGRLAQRSEEALRKAGVIEDRPLPVPFPGPDDFAPPPRGTRGTDERE
jgi:hypothetical protein